MIPNLSIIVPAFDEAGRIGPTLEALDDYLADSPMSYEIVVVDDGSTDGTAGIVEEMARSRPAIRCVRPGPNRGKGHAVRVGMLESAGEVRVMYDADGAIAPDQLPGVVNPVTLGEVDIAIGSRYAWGAEVTARQPWWRRAWSRIANGVVRATVVGGIRDTQCGCKALSATAARAVFSRAQIDGWAFDLEALALARRLGLSVREVAVIWSDDPRSRVSAARDLGKVVREWLAIQTNFARGVYGDLAPGAGASLPG